jgi:hypothetical protein
MARPNVFNLRLSDEELQNLKAFAASKQISPAEVLRNYVKKLPNSGTSSPVVGRGESMYPAAK